MSAPTFPARVRLDEVEAVLRTSAVDLGAPGHDIVYGDGLITGETRYYTKPFDAPAWRAGLVEAIS